MLLKSKASARHIPAYLESQLPQLSAFHLGLTMVSASLFLESMAQAKQPRSRASLAMSFRLLGSLLSLGLKFRRSLKM